jgi:hypothetical protein
MADIIYNIIIIIMDYMIPGSDPAKYAALALRAARHLVCVRMAGVCGHVMVWRAGCTH